MRPKTEDTQLLEKQDGRKRCTVEDFGRLHNLLSSVCHKNPAAADRQMIRDGVLDHLQQTRRRVSRLDRELVQQLHHQPSKPRECPKSPVDADLL